MAKVYVHTSTCWCLLFTLSHVYLASLCCLYHYFESGCRSWIQHSSPLKLSTIWHVSINTKQAIWHHWYECGKLKTKMCSSSSKTSREHRLDTWCDFLKNLLPMSHTQTTQDSNATYNLSNEPPAECKDPHIDCLIGLPRCITLKQRLLSKKRLSQALSTPLFLFIPVHQVKSDHTILILVTKKQTNYELSLNLSIWCTYPHAGIR